MTKKSLYICSMPRKNRPIIVLMLSSIVVLMLLQVLWLRAVYEDYYNGLKQETNLLFASTVSELVDSLIWKGASQVRGPLLPVIDSLKEETSRKLIFRRMDLQEALSEDRKEPKFSIQVIVDSTTKITDFSNEGTVRVISSDTNLASDSIRRIIRPIILGADSLKGQRFEINLRRDLVELELIEEVFNKRLKEEGYYLTATISKLDSSTKYKPENNDWLQLDDVSIPFGVRFQANFEQYKGYLLKKMLPTFLFGLLALSLVIVSFVFLYRSILQQQRLHALKNDLINNITHELKTPVATVGVVLEALENFGADQKASTKQEYIQIAQNELNRLSKMAESILKSNVLGQQNDQKQAIDFDDLVSEQLISFKPILVAKGFTVEMHKQNSDYFMQGFEESLKLMVYNLLDNAIKYSPAAKKISIRLSLNEGILQFEIEDQGIGIAEKFHGDIFEKFIRVPQKNIHDVKGYGLGLAQVNSAVKQHKGKIYLKSSLGKGTNFTIQLPING